MSEAFAYVPFEAFLDGEVRSEQRHELVGGRIYVHAGGSERHDVAAGLIYESLAAGARSAGCRPFMGNRMLKTPRGNCYYPDVFVACGPAADRLFETSASLIVEVLSPSTSGVDRREKAVAYAELPTLAQLVLVHPHDRRMEVAVPAGGRIDRWESFGPGQVLFTNYSHIVIDSLYDDIERIATTV